MSARDDESAPSQRLGSVGAELGGERQTNSDACDDADGAIELIRLPNLPGVEVMDVQGVSRQWAYFHETYSFCVARWVEDTREIPWKYRLRTHRMTVDRVQLMEPGEFHANLMVAPRANFRVLMLAPSLVEKVARQLGHEHAFPLHLSTAQLGDGPVRQLLHKLTSIIVEAGDAQRADDGICRLLQLLSQQRCFETTLAPPSRKQSRRAALLARDLIHDRWNEHLSLNALSAEVGLPLSTLERAFGEAFATSPRQYQNHVRLVRGKGLLLNTADPIRGVAENCGFSDPKYFARLFRREFGCGPQSYRGTRHVARPVIRDASEGGP
jgi:AraC-like DNA-binding protein